MRRWVLAEGLWMEFLVSQEDFGDLTKRGTWCDLRISKGPPFRASGLCDTELRR